MPADRGLPAPIAAARAISSEARVAPTGATSRVRRSVHSFHRLHCAFNERVEQWDAWPNLSIMFLNAAGTVDSAPLRGGCGQKRCLFPALNEAACAVSGSARPRWRPDSLNVHEAVSPANPQPLRATCPVQKLNAFRAICGVGNVLEDEHISLFDAGLGGRSGRELERRDRASRSRDAPWREPVLDADDRASPGRGRRRRSGSA